MGHKIPIERMLYMAASLNDELAEPDLPEEKREFGSLLLAEMEAEFRTALDDVKALRAKLEPRTDPNSRAVFTYVEALLRSVA